MNDEQHREQLFATLRQALKSHGYTYSKLGEALGVSELTVKRLFRDKDCKMSRLIEICSVIGLSFSDLVSMQERIHSSAQYLPVKVEEEIAKQPDLFACLILLISHISPQKIAQEYGLSDSQLYRYLRELEKLDVLEVLENNQIRFSVSLPIRLRFNGPLGEQIKQANKNFISHCITNNSDPEYTFFAGSRLMRPSSIAQLQEQFAQLQKDYDYLATQDQMFFGSEDLQLYKAVYGLGPFPVMKIFPLRNSQRLAVSKRSNMDL